MGCIGRERHTKSLLFMIFGLILVGPWTSGQAASLREDGHATDRTEPTPLILVAQSRSTPSPNLSHSLQFFASVATDEEIPVMAETVVEGSAVEESSFEDFDDPFEEDLGEEVYDPWEPFNSAMFTFNYRLDRHVLKPVAKGHDWVVPPDAQDSIGNAFDNIGFPHRFLNDIFQGKFKTAGVELSRFLINSTIGIGGFFDVAKYGFDIEAPHAEDTGQTMAHYGAKSGPYLVLPFLPPMTVRDGVGFAGDVAMNPLNWFVPLVPNFSARVGETVNERSRNLESFEGIEESTVDLYGAVRSGYFQKRSQAIKK